MLDVLLAATDSKRLHADFCHIVDDEGMAGPAEALQTAGVPGGVGGSTLVIVLAFLFVLSLHALITGRALSPSVQARGPRTVRVLGGVGLAFALFGYLIDRTHDRVLATIGLGVILAFVGHQVVTRRGRDGWGRELSPASARAWGLVAIGMVLLCAAKMWACSP
jgi:hypothetical protein